MLDGKLTLTEVGTALMRIADCNSFAPEQEHGPCPADPPGAFLHGLLALPGPFAAGSFRVTDIATVFVEPGCRNGLRTWRHRRKGLDSTGRSNFSIKVPRVDASIRVPHTENPVRVRAAILPDRCPAAPPPGQRPRLPRSETAAVHLAGRAVEPGT
ncbi:hypothetical protein [Streptomyces sp. NPDC127119]|uniref:hypothetical protein n=1 Tax=Streptomyces sp. NPDC127119 TaxID=3345370 RepID=UPI0036336508